MFFGPIGHLIAATYIVYMVVRFFTALGKREKWVDSTSSLD